MTNHTVGTREEWLAARDDLLTREKELTRQNDELLRTPRPGAEGRDEGDPPEMWIRRHDEYEDPAAKRTS